jgi:hypothetical protein
MQAETEKAGEKSLVTWGKAAFVVALVLTLTLCIMGILGIPWPRWLLALTNIL